VLEGCCKLKRPQQGTAPCEYRKIIEHTAERDCWNVSAAQEEYKGVPLQDTRQAPGVGSATAGSHDFRAT
jgi:hypothetical protein